MNGETGTVEDAIAQLRAAVLADPALQAELGAFDEMDAALPRIVACAQDLGLRLDADALRPAMRADPVGLGRFSGGPPRADRPPPGWLPIQLAPLHGQLCVDWAWFGPRPLSEPFFEDSIRRAMHRPLNRLARFRTPLADLPACADALAVQRPAGFIFHMSRCGSTLAAQMLAADPRNVVVSEAAPLDTIVRLATIVPGLDGALHDTLLRAMTGALLQRRMPAHARGFVKLDSWHTLALPLFRRAYPDVPWVFLYREPKEVLASQMLQRGIQTVPEFMPPEIFGLSFTDSLDSDDYCARVLGRTCEAVLEPFAKGGGLLVNYSELPGALFTRILPHFGVAFDAAERAVMEAPVPFDAKTPNMHFAPREDAKQQLMTEDLLASAERHIGPVYRALEGLRLGV